MTDAETETARPITPRGIELNLDAARPFAARHAARHLLRTARLAALATLDPSGYPYNTMTNLIVEPDGTPLFYAAGLAVHARNIARDPRIALTLAEVEAPDMLTAHRLTLAGTAERVRDNEMPLLKDAYLRRHPKAKLYLALPDSQLFRLRIEGVQINGGPARNANDVRPEDFRTDLAGADDLMARALPLIDELNGADLLPRLAAAAGAGEGRWRVTGIDPEGVTLANKTRNARIWFDRRLTTAAALRGWAQGLATG